MKLAVPFVQLPVQFDAAALAEEIAALDEAAWRPHPQKYPGNFALPLIAANGDPDSDSVAGPMRPTAHLAACPRIRAALAQLGAVWGRTRLMKLGPNAEVSVHADTNYYWRERVRVHIPILTQPEVRFVCGDAEVNMAAGECWIFDTWRRHRVVNAHVAERVHLVADTVGSTKFWEQVKQGRIPGRESADWQPRRLQYDAAAAHELLLESSNVPEVMTPWELRAHLSFLVSETAPSPQRLALEQCARQLLATWRVLWAEYGESREGRQLYRKELEAFAQQVRPLSVGLLLANGMEWMATLRAMILRYAVNDIDAMEQSVPDEHLRSPAATSGRGSAARVGSEPEFDAPVFIISPPRSGSTLLFETMHQACGLYSTGRESHPRIEGIPELRPFIERSDSNRLDADAATPAVVAELRRRFLADLRDRDGRPPHRLPIRMLEKTPKNALRIPFLARAFPEARFVYLYREPRQTLGSMIDAWQSGHFRTYPNLPGWQGLPWSLLLVPGWRALVGKPLAEIVAAQWRITTRQILEDLASVPADRCLAIDYADFLAQPQRCMVALCAALGLEWDRPIEGALPLSRHTLTAPDPEKWRRHRDELEKVLPQLHEEDRRAREFARARFSRSVASAPA